MIGTKRTLAAILAASVSCLPAVAMAQDKSPPSAFVLAHAHDFADGKLNEGQLMELSIIAHQAALASVCEGVEVDDKKFKSAFEKIRHESHDEMTEEQRDYFDKHVLVVYGVKIGGFLADAATTSTEDYCSGIDEEIKDPEFAALSVLK